MADEQATQTQEAQGEQNAATQETFYSGYDEDTKAYIQNKGWDDPKKILDSYRNLESHIGVSEDKLIRLPKDDDPEGMKNIYRKLGMPDDPKDYGIEQDELGASQWFHEAGLNKNQAQTLLTKYAEAAKMFQDKQAEAFAVQSQNEMKELEQEWGSNYTKNMEMAKRAAMQFGVDADTIDQMEKVVGTKKLFSLFSSIGQGLGEAKYVDGNSSGSFGGVEAAQKEVEMLKADKEWMASYMAGDRDKYEKLSSLYKIIANG